jgi:hypothetical protein
MYIIVSQKRYFYCIQKDEIEKLDDSRYELHNFDRSAAYSVADVVYFFFYVLFFFLVFRFLSYGRVTINNGWNTSSVGRTTVSELMV